VNKRSSHALRSGGRNAIGRVMGPLIPLSSSPCKSGRVAGDATIVSTAASFAFPTRAAAEPS